MKICIDCRDKVEVKIVRLHEGAICPQCGGEVISAKEFYAEAVKELNEKGYYVASCLPKFINSTNGVTSITFDECVDSFPYLPNDCYVKVIGPKGERRIQLIYEFVDCETELSILRNSLNVYLWALKLPAVGTDEYYNTLKTCYINNMGEDPL